MALTTVSFAKPIEAKPRHSAKYVPGHHSKRFWTEEEKQVLRDHYEERGAQYCAVKLPNRGIHRVHAMANKLGLHRKMGGANKVYVDVTPELDARIREEWLALTGKVKGEVTALADKLDVRCHWLSQRALKLGLVVPRVAKEPEWTAAELELLKRVPLHDPRRAAMMFRENGFIRTPAALCVKAKRLDISRRYDETLSAGKAAKILGVDGKAFTVWIAKGIIQAERRETARLPQQGGNPWSISRAYFRQWIIDNIEVIDIRKVDKFAFVDLLTRQEEP